MAEDDVSLEEAPETDTPEGDEEELSPEKKLLARLKETIDVKQEEVGTLRRRLTITIPRATIDERMGEQFDELRRDAIVPGFRKGRAPLRLVEKRFGADVGEQLLTALVSSSFLAATEKHDIKVLGDPLFRVTVKEDRTDADGRLGQVETEKLVDIKQALDHIKLPHDGPLSYACEVDLRPEFELPSLDGIPVKRPDLTITDQDIDIEVQRMLMSRATLSPVTSGPVEADDAVIVDLKLVGPDSAVLRSESNALLAARDQTYDGIPLKGLGAALAGKQAGETGKLQVTIPDDHEEIGLRGKEATLEFNVLEYKRLSIPPLDADLLTSLGYDSEQDLRDTLRSTLELGLSLAIQRGMRNQVAAYLIENTKLDIPGSLSLRQASRLLERRLIELYQDGVPEPEIAKHMDELRTAAQTEAVNDLKLFFIITKIADEREIDVTEEELNGAISSIAARRNVRFDRMRDDLSKGGGLDALALRLRDDKVLDTLLETATITETEGPAAQSAGQA